MRRKPPIYIRKDSPYYWGWYYDSTGSRVVFNTKCRDRRAAEDAVRNREREAHAPGGLSKNAQAHSLGEALKWLVEIGASDIAPATLRQYAIKGGHLLRLLGDVDVNDLSIDIVQGYINHRLEEGAQRETVRKDLVVLRRALLSSKERGLLRTCLLYTSPSPRDS